MSSNFQDYSSYYDLLYKDKDYQGETDYIHQLIQQHAGKANALLELGSGTGKHAHLLAAKGYQVYGIERSESMVGIAQQYASEQVQFEVGDISTFSLSKKFDVAISLFHVVSYLTSNEELVATFKNTAAHLQTGGFFIFDVWYSPAVYYQQPQTRIKRLQSEDVNITRLAEPVIHARENVVDVNYEVMIEKRKTAMHTTLKEKHPMRHFSEPEIGLLAACTGFTVVGSEEFLTGNTPGTSTWGVCFILQKR